MDYTAVRRESIIYSAIDLIDEQGIQAVSTREVAKRQGISHTAVFQYFPKKKDLLYAVLEHYSLYDDDLFNTTKLRKMDPREAIIYYFDSYSVYYENYPAITAVAQVFSVLKNDPDLGDKLRSILKNREEHMKQMIEDAQTAGVINGDIDCESLSDIVISTVLGICHKWRIYGYKFSLREKTIQAVNMLLDAFRE